MRTAKVALYDGEERFVWGGPLREFFRANAYDRIEASRAIKQLRLAAQNRRPLSIGGGAAPAFYLVVLS